LAFAFGLDERDFRHIGMHVLSDFVESGEPVKPPDGEGFSAARTLRRSPPAFQADRRIG
jgi:hypothetical protein